MLYVTGDMHGDRTRFQSKALRKLKKNDSLLVCGDFGFLWDGSKKEKRFLKWLGKRKYNILFIEGTHDNLDLLATYPITEWNGGKVRQISGNLRQLCRGSVFTIEGKRIFAFGGGESPNASDRIPGISWWSGEMPIPAELEAARANLRAHNNHVDYIITHQCSWRIHAFLDLSEKDPNLLNTFFDEVRATCRFKRWFFGNYHINKQIPPAEFALFDSVVSISADKLLKN